MGSVTILGDLTIHANNFATLNKKNFTLATHLKFALNFFDFSVERFRVCVGKPFINEIKNSVIVIRINFNVGFLIVSIFGM